MLNTAPTLNIQILGSCAIECWSFILSSSEGKFVILIYSAKTSLRVTDSTCERFAKTWQNDNGAVRMAPRWSTAREITWSTIRDCSQSFLYRVCKLAPLIRWRLVDLGKNTCRGAAKQRRISQVYWTAGLSEVAEQEHQEVSGVDRKTEPKESRFNLSVDETGRRGRNRTSWLKSALK